MRAYQAAWHRVPIAMSCPRSRLSFFLCQEKRSGLRCVTFLFRVGRNRLLCVLTALCGYRVSLVYFWLARFLQAIPTELRRDAELRRTGSAARCECAFTQSHQPCHVFRGEYAGAEMWKPHCGRPRLRQRVIDSLDSLHLIRGNVRFTRGRLVRIRCAVRRLIPPRSPCPFRRAGAPIRHSPRRREYRDTGRSPIRSIWGARCRRAPGAWT